MAEAIKTGNSDEIITDRYGTPVPMGWNWGAFLLPWHWSLRHNVPVRYYFIPIFGDFWPFRLGKKGSRLAWENCEWESAEDFIRVQRNWARCGFGVYLSFFIIILVALLLFYYGI